MDISYCSRYIAHLNVLTVNGKAAPTAVPIIELMLILSVMLM